MRTGSYEVDDTHKVDGRQPPNGGPGSNAPLDDDPDVLRRVIWLETDKQYRAAAEALIKIKTGKEVKVQTEEGSAPDFSREKPQILRGPWLSFTLDRKPWEQKVRDYTAYFRQSSAVINSIVTFTAVAQNTLQLTSKARSSSSARFAIGSSFSFRARPPMAWTSTGTTTLIGLILPTLRVTRPCMPPPRSFARKWKA